MSTMQSSSTTEVAETKTFNLETFLKAMEANGYNQARGSWIRFNKDGTKVLAACAMGQAVLNLDIDLDDFINKRDPWYGEHGNPWHKIASRIMEMNDYKKWPIQKIADTARKEYADLLDLKMTVKKASKRKVTR